MGSRQFNTATEAGLDRLIFMLDTEAPNVGIPLARLIDREFGGRQDAFRYRVKDSGLVMQSFDSPAKLGQLVERSLRTRQRIVSGIIRVNRPGFGGDIDPTERWSHVSTDEASARGS